MDVSATVVTQPARANIDIRFAVTAPWCIELHENILVIVQNDVFVVVRHDNLYRAILLFGDGFRLDAWLHLPVDKILNELANFFLCERFALVQRELLIFDSLLDRKGGPFVGLEVQVVSVSTESFGVDGCEADDSLMFFRHRLESFSKFITLLGRLGEDVGQGNTSLTHTRQLERKNSLDGNVPPCSQRMSLGRLRQPRV